MTTDDRKRELKAHFKSVAQQKLLESLPLDIQTLKDLLSHLDKNSAQPCEHTLKDTIEFLNEHNIDSGKVIPWLQEHGGYCDCEVIYNVYDATGDLVDWHLDEKT